MRVIKFGGSSLDGERRLVRAAQIARDEEAALVVVSALGDTTDRLLDAGEAAERGDSDTVRATLEQIEARHLQLAGDDRGLAEVVASAIAELSSVLEGVRLLREITGRSRALIASFGERLAAPLFAAALSRAGREARAVDARELIVTGDGPDSAVVLREPTWRRAREKLLPLLEEQIVPVVTGYIAATASGVTTTLGRSGSDYTATLLGAALGAEAIDIYTDVAGILTADPALVKEARSLDRVSYREAAEMAYFGARVLHPHTIVPAEEERIPLRIRSALEPDAPGTVIGPISDEFPYGVKTVTSVHDQALITLDGRGMAGVVGVARRIFEASELVGINVVMISQASSEQTVSLVVAERAADRLERALRERFAPELARGSIERIVCRPQVAVVSIIGRGMAGTPGIAGKLFGALGSTGVNVRAIAQGGSELSISVAVEQHETERAVRAVHSAFGLTRLVNLVLIGCGRVGRSFVEMLGQTHPRMKAEHDLELRLIGVATSRAQLLDADGIDTERALAPLDADELPRSADEQLIERLAAQRFTDVVVVDVTAADTTPLHRLALEAGFHVVTANKLPVAGPLASYRQLVAARKSRGALYHYETTFGAGLPVLHTLRELLDTGDRIRSIGGCLSGTLGFICSELDRGAAIDQVVEQARKLGFTEPDPREDLSGRDVARKALIIARACGMELEPEDVVLEPLVPGLERGLADALAAFAPKLTERQAAARAEGKVLRYLAEIRPGGPVEVGLRAVAADSPTGGLSGPDNMLVFHTQRYDAHPLIIRGPGAGAEVTAAGVLGDVMKIARA